MKKTFKAPMVILLLGVLFLPHGAGNLFAQQYPSKPIQIVVPWSAGDTDLITRLAASVLPNSLGQPTVVFNKPGAQGIVGTDFVFKAPADGYTLVANGPAHMIVPMIQKTPFTVDDFVPVVQTANSKGVVLVKKDAPWASLKEFLAEVKKQPEMYKYGSPGPGTWHNFKWEIIKNQSGVNIVAVPFQGNAPIVAALLGGHISIALIEKPTALAHVQGGTLKALAISEKDDAFPGVMTFEEQGFKGDFNNWKALFVRKGVPQDRMKILEEACAKMLTDKSFLVGLEKIGAAPGKFAGEKFRQFIEVESVEIAKIVEKVFKKQ